jgi:hypothetical protein
VTYTVGLDPVEIGFDVVAPGQAWQQFVGYPVIDASVTADAPGYRGLCGWVQLISNVDDVHGDVEVQVDRYPFVEDAKDPLTCFGYLPRFFDAPANPHHPDGLWLAELFVVEVDVRSRVAAARLGLSWATTFGAGSPSYCRSNPFPCTYGVSTRISSAATTPAGRSTDDSAGPQAPPRGMSLPTRMSLCGSREATMLAGHDQPWR